MVVGRLSEHEFSLCMEAQIVCQCEVKSVARVVKAKCLLMSRPAKWIRTQMGFLSGGLCFWVTASVFGETWKPSLEWTGILLNEERLRTQDVNRRDRQWKLVCVLGGCWDEVSETVNSLWFHQLSVLDFCASKHSLAANGVDWRKSGWSTALLSFQTTLGSWQTSKFPSIPQISQMEDGNVVG